MQIDNQFERPTVGSIAKYVKKNAAKTRAAQPHHRMPAESVREADYKGHHIVIRTTYVITVDAMAITGHMGVTNDGQVHYHPIPNVSFGSAVDLVKRLIDVFPDDFGPGAGKHMAPGHPMNMRGPSPRKKPQNKAKRKTRSARK